MALSGAWGSRGRDELAQEPERSRPEREEAAGPSLTQRRRRQRSRPLPGRPGHQRHPALLLLLPRLLTRGSECLARPPGVTGSGHLRPASPSGGRCRSARKGRRRGKERARRRRGSGGRGPWRGRDPPAAPWPLGIPIRGGETGVVQVIATCNQGCQQPLQKASPIPTWYQFGATNLYFSSGSDRKSVV